MAAFRFGWFPGHGSATDHGHRLLRQETYSILEDDMRTVRRCQCWERCLGSEVTDESASTKRKCLEFMSPLRLDDHSAHVRYTTYRLLDVNYKAAQEHGSHGWLGVVCMGPTCFPVSQDMGSLSIWRVRQTAQVGGMVMCLMA